MIPTNLRYNRATGQILCGAIELAEVRHGDYVGDNHELGRVMANGPRLLEATEKLIEALEQAWSEIGEINSRDLCLIRAASLAAEDAVRYARGTKEP